MHHEGLTHRHQVAEINIKDLKHMQLYMFLSSLT